MGSGVRKLGVDVLGAVPWGTHICHFYHTKQDLIDVLVPYFRAGLENNESCLWITSNNLSVKEAEAAMEQAVPEFPRYLASRQMAIIPHTEWYLKDGPFNGKRALIAWVNKVWQALDSGYNGVRVTGDAGWHEKKDWQKLIDYEEEVNSAIGRYCMLAICTYPLHKINAGKIIDVERNHQYSLVKHKDNLVFIGSPGREQGKEILSEEIDMRQEYLAITRDIFVAINSEGKVAFINRKGCEVLGYEEKEIIGQNWFDNFIPPRIKSDLLSVSNNLLSGEIESAAYYINPVLTKSGEERIVAWHNTVLRDDRGNITSHLSSGEDITERKRAEEELRESEEKYRAVLERSSDSIVLMNEEERALVDFNEKAYQNLGYSREEFARLRMTDIDVIESNEEAREHLRKLKREGIDVFETKHRTKDGEIRDVLVSVRRLHTSDKNYVLVVWHYLAERPVDEALQMSEPRYRELFQGIDEGVMVAGEGKRYLDCNEAVLKMLGYSREEFLSLTLDDIVHPDHKQVLNEEPARVWIGETMRLESAYCAKDGRVIPVEVVACRIDYQGKPAILTTVRDITERKLAEEKQHTILETALDGYWVNDLEGRFLEVNDAYCKMTGYTREELLEMSIQDIEAVENPEEIEAHIKRGVEQGYEHFESRHRCKDGRIIDVEVNTNYLDVGEVQAFSFCRDITTRRAEEAQGMLRSASTRPLTQLQERFIRSGFQELEDREAIELLLSLVLPARKARQLARACLERFQNLRGFLAASSEELEQAGITVPCMLCIRLLHELPIKVLQERLTERAVYKSSQEVFDYLYYSMRDLREEVFKVIYLNNRSQIIDTADLFEGNAEYIPVRPREIVESAITHNASGLVFVHNHPTGDPTPSKTDKQLTRDLVFVGRILQIKILDHIIIGDNSYFSFADDGLLQKYEDSFLNLKIRGVLASTPFYQQNSRLSGGSHHRHRESVLSHIGTYLMRRKKTSHRFPAKAGHTASV